MKDTKHYITKAKQDELEQELANLKSTKRKKILEDLEYAKSLGDLSENAEYHQAREEQGKLEDRINKVEAILKDSVLVEKHHSTIVEVGSTITIKKEGDKEIKIFTIVGSEEVDASSGKISNTSPLGLVLMGKKKGDTAVFTSPKGPISYTIISVE